MSKLNPNKHFCVVVVADRATAPLIKIIFIEMKIIHICNFLDIDCYENLQEYFFVWNQFLIIKEMKKNA